MMHLLFVQTWQTGQGKGRPNKDWKVVDGGVTLHASMTQRTRMVNI